ncbi:hypothetical protein GCM10023149_30840 [Mucilaginibacter gynuensis]|uniref:Uncharacterized protein n=1 Tax=Mucilaginibacter gynuensis TaxID=1302236 RepID=A0ABP8GN66_9SPHI
MNKVIKASDIKGDTAYDIILRAWLDHKVEALALDKQQMLERWRMIDKLIRQGEVVRKVNDAGDLEDQHVRYNFSSLVEWIRQGYNVSARTAYEDIKNAKRFFLCCEGTTDVEYSRGVQIEWGEMMMFKAFESGDFSSASKFYKELNKIKGLHDQRLDLPNYDEFVPPSFVITSDPTELGFEKIENKDEIVARILSEKRNGFIDNEAEDAEVIE